jgi:hypothetical protein
LLYQLLSTSYQWGKFSCRSLPVKSRDLSERAASCSAIARAMRSDIMVSSSAGVAGSPSAPLLLLVAGAIFFNNNYQRLIWQTFIQYKA